MAIYVDEVQDYGGKYRNCSHMWADDVEELHAFAQQVGMKRGWFQNRPDFPHYDVFGGLRAKAVALGAIETDRRVMVAFVNARREARAK